MASSPEPAIRVPASFDDEFPTASRRSTETFLNLGILVGGVRGSGEAIIAGAGLPSMAAFNVLSVLAGDPSPLRPSVIAERMMVTRATITGVLDSLEARRLVRRVADPSDGRSFVVSITKPGRRIVDALVPRMHDFEHQLMSALTDRQLDELCRMVAVLQRRLFELDDNARLGLR